MFSSLFQFSLKTNFRSIYTAFDPYPSYKGSAIHIDKVTGVMAQKFDSLLLLTLENAKQQILVEGITHLEFPTEERNFLKRAFAYSDWVDSHLEKQYNLEVGHFRDIWGGLPIIRRKHITSVFEVNGLPSIELPNRFSSISADTLSKIRELETRCLREASVIICPSETIKKHIVGRGILESKIHVIPNGATVPEQYPKPTDLPTRYFVYFGALQPWQGIGTLLKSLKYLKDKPELKLVICSSHKEKHARPYKKLIQKLDVEEQVIWKYQLEKRALQAILQHAICTVAPLTECSRNLEQGCSPLKIFESMACRVPIIASDLPVIREILAPDEAKFFRAERPAELARCIRLISDYSEFGNKISKNAYQKLKSEYTWERIDKKLAYIYDNLLELTF
ncbi:MAG: glycosyltransferase involved in cell wall biosynthesis [Arenicella sp.]|jgi:glycosyltransferase involved in cell wall biosynthesis